MRKTLTVVVVFSLCAALAIWLRGQRSRRTVPSHPLHATVTVDASKILRQIPRTVFGAGMEWPFNGNLLWLEKENRPDPRIVAFTKQLGLSLIRYPGGYYSDFYHWRNGVGTLNMRPEVATDASKANRSRAIFGTDEALALSAEVGAELLITVNAGTGTPQEAADWVRYVNANGLRVRYWEVGNELYINDGSPIAKASTLDPAAYAARFRDFAQAMKAADNRILVGAIGGRNQGRYAFNHYPDWDRIVLTQDGGLMDFFAVHNAYAPVSISDADDVRSVYEAILAAPVQIARNLADVAHEIDEYAGPRAPRIPIAVTEWGPLFQVDPKGKFAQHTKTLGSALFVASVLKTFIESPRTEIANFHVLNDLGFMGWIGSASGDFPPHPEWRPTARYYAFELLSRHFGSQLVQSSTQSPGFDAEALGAVAEVKNVPDLDLMAGLSADGSQLSVVGINRSLDAPLETEIMLQGFDPASEAETWTLNGTSIDANTGTQPLRAPGLKWGKQKEFSKDARFAHGAPSEISFRHSTFNGAQTKFTYSFPAHSATALVMNRRSK